MDDTLIDGNDFYSQMEKYLNNTVHPKMKEVLENILKDYSINRSDIILDSDVRKIKFKSIEKLDLINVNGYYILKPNSDFYDLEESLGDKLINNVYKIFKSSKNNCIITGRRESMRKKVINNLLSLNLIPNKGIYLTPDNVNSSKETALFKYNVLKVFSNIYEAVLFFDDKESWLEIIKNKSIEDNINNLKLYRIENGRVLTF